MAIKMIVSSIEETMIHHEPRIPQYIKHLNRRLADSGVILSYFTGMMPYNFQPFREDIGADADVIYAHGSFSPDGTANHSFEISPLKSMISEALEHGITVSIQYGSSETRLTPGDNEVTAKLENEHAYRVSLENPLINSTLRELENKYASTLSSCRIYRNKLSSMEILSSESNKGSAITSLASKYGFTPDEILVIGASAHDVPAFERVEHSVSVGNADYRLKAKAAYVADRNYDSGYIEAIRAYFPEITATSKVNSLNAADWYE